ncbi:MAG: S9 family peptidase [Porphyrobacter sp.]|nr:S9 family peptidase [Porphyrobacter sp.]
MADSTPLTPPVAAKKPFSVTHHGITVSDDYAWLRDPKYPKVKDKKVLAHLAAENAWFEARMKPHEATVDALFKEMRARIKEADKSVPQKDGDWLYWIEFEEGAEYKKWWRKPVAGGPDELILDEPALAEGKEYFRLGAISVSKDGKLLAYSTDDNGSERFTARIKDLVTGEHLPDKIPGTLSALLWVAGDKGLVYSLANEQWRTDNARLHWLGKPISEDVELYHEADEGFRVSAALSAAEDWIVIGTGDHETSEAWLVPADAPLTPPRMVRARQKGVEYDVDVRPTEGGATLFVHANDTHENFRLATASLERPDAWETLIAGSDEFYLTGFELFRDFYVVDGRVRGLDRLEIRYYDDPARIEPVEFPEASYTASLGNNPEFDQTVLRLSYESMVSPASTYDYAVAARELTLLKVQDIPSGYDRSLYATERLEIAARDGTKIPVSVMYRKDRKAPGPLHLYGYGAYGIAIPPGFSTTRLSLVDRGFAYAIAHIRGGDDLGRAWYKAGKLEHRTNAFTDFVDVAKGLIAKGYTEAGRISISGGSAGGELMGAVINSDPQLWGAVVAHVPFVDVLATMLDASLPLTPGEWPEWGNPIEDAKAFELIRSYSPYDNVRAQAYPPLLVTAGLNDPRVTYWEPAKWVAKLREFKTDDRELLLKTNMGAGHGGKSGRFESLKETAEEFAFILWQMGVAA